jgi:hypothetical protein
MTVSQQGVIDWLGVEKETGDIVLTVVDQLDWSDEREHIRLLQEKLNTYLACIESGEVFTRVKELGGEGRSGTPIKVAIVARFDLTAQAQAFLRHATHIFAGVGVALSHRVQRDPEAGKPI